MEEIKLEDLVPQGASFMLRKTGKSYRLNPVTLGDELWLQQTFGETLADVFSKVQMKEVCRIVFRLMHEQDKVDFAATQVTFMNEEGEILKKKIGGAELLYLNVSGFGEKIEIFQALMQTLGVSRPVLEKLTTQDESPPPEKKRSKPTGPESSISSPVSTGGQLSTSLRARRVNLRTELRQSKSGRENN